MWSRAMTAMTAGFTAGRDAWRFGPRPAEWDVQQQLYLERWAAYSGSLFEGMADANQWATNQPAIYANTKLLWKHHEAMVNFYASVVYRGSLSVDGMELPEGVPNAIPLVFQAGSEARDQLLSDAVSALWAAWNWQQQMKLRPMYGAAIGDVMTELVDNTERRFVFPRIIWPGYVKVVELDDVDNVRAYTLEYQVQERDRQGKVTETYKYTKEVDGETFRYYKDDRPFDYGDGAVVPNPYGFVPAIWDRHLPGAMDSVRGKSATDGTRQALLQLNSLLAHSFDFQHKAFWVPPMLASRGSGGKSDPDPAGPATTGRTLAETFRMRNVPEGSTLLQPQFDVGKTLEMLAFIREGILSENPEASFYQQLREMQQVTAPGANQLTGDVENRVKMSSDGYDIQTVKLFQMAITMCGFRSRDTGEDGWSRQGVRLDRRRLAFVPFDLESFDRGELAMSILPRKLVDPTEQERMETELLKVQVLGAKEGLQSEWAIREALPDLSDDEVAAMLAERREREAGYLMEDLAPRDAEDVA